MSTEVLTMAGSVLALVVSIYGLWLNHFHSSPLNVVRPPKIYFGPDGPGVPKVAFPTWLLYASGRRGRAIESMYAEIERSDGKFVFELWVIGDEGYFDLGGGLFVEPNGHATAHHFIFSDKSSTFSFAAGKYTLRIYALLARAKRSEMIFEQEFAVSSDHSQQLATSQKGLQFSWSPSQNKYLASIEEPDPVPEKANSNWFSTLRAVPSAAKSLMSSRTA